MSGQHLTSSGGEKNIPSQDGMGQPDPGAGPEGRFRVGLEDFLLLRQPSPHPLEVPGALALPLGQSGAVVQTFSVD